MKTRFCKAVDVCFKGGTVVSFKPNDTVKFFVVKQTRFSIGVYVDNEEYPSWFCSKTGYRNCQYFSKKQLSLA